MAFLICNLGTVYILGQLALSYSLALIESVKSVTKITDGFSSIIQQTIVLLFSYKMFFDKEENKNDDIGDCLKETKHLETLKNKTI